MHIGILEDDPTLARHLAQVVESAGHSTAVFNTARAFLSALARHTFDLLVFDWKLPDQDGIKVLKQLKEQGKTVIVVEHDEKIMMQADYIIDMGPEAGFKGGEVVFSGNGKELLKNKKSLTAQYLNHQLTIQRKNSNPLRIDFKDFSKIKFKDYFYNYKKYMNIISHNEIINFIK
jgi:CheY-like chemotaxis protein